MAPRGEGCFRRHLRARVPAANRFTPGTWTSVPVVVAVVPGDWKDQLNTYLAWVRSWHKPLVPRQQWFREVFAFAPGDPTSNMSLP